MNMDHWKYPLSSGDAAVVAKSMEGMRTSLRNAKLWGSDAVLLVPAVVNPQTSYLEAWTRSQKQIRELIPMAAELKVVIAIEEVWNKFLLSPLEMKKYIDGVREPVDQGVVRRGECGALRVSARLDSNAGEEDFECAFEGLQAETRWICLGEFGRRRCGLGGGEGGVCGDRICGERDCGIGWRR